MPHWRTETLFSLGVSSLEVVHLGGHTPGSIALVYDDPSGGAHLFTGDGLFPGGVGGTWGDREAFDILFGNVRHRLFEAFPDDAWVYPGHGDDTTLGRERPISTSGLLAAGEPQAPGRHAPGRLYPSAECSCSRTRARRSAAALSRGSLPLPHLGDCTHAGQPEAQGQRPIASLVAVSHSSARW